MSERFSPMRKERWISDDFSPEPFPRTYGPQ